MAFRLTLLLTMAAITGITLSACTQAERDGYNPKPFNAPAAWEYQPYGDAFRN